MSVHSIECSQVDHICAAGDTPHRLHLAVTDLKAEVGDNYLKFLVSTCTSASRARDATELAFIIILVLELK